VIAESRDPGDLQVNESPVTLMSKSQGHKTTTENMARSTSDEIFHHTLVKVFYDLYELHY